MRERAKHEELSMRELSMKANIELRMKERAKHEREG